MRQVRLLENLANLSIIGFGDKPNSKTKFFQVKQPNNFLDRIRRAIYLLFGFYERYYWSQPHIQESLRAVGRQDFDLIVANDLSALPVAIEIAGKGKVLFDAHEYSPREGEEKILWRLTHGKFNKFLCKKYLHVADLILTVSDGISEEYFSEYGVPSKVVYNAPNYQNIVPKKTVKKTIRLIHHGAAIKFRHIETMIEMMEYVDDRYSLDLMLVETNAAYYKALKTMAQKNPKINFIPAVPMEFITQHIKNYDIGVYILPPVNFNHINALPNKFFEFIQARLALAIGPSLEMRKMIDRYHIGIVAKSFLAKDLAHELNKLNSSDIDNFKMASNKVAFELSSEAGAKIILESVEALIGPIKTS